MSLHSSPWVTIIALLLLTIAIALGGSLLLHHRPEPTLITIHPPRPTFTPEPSPTPTITQTPVPTATPDPVQVYVTGEVAQPDRIYILPYASRVTDAIAAAGGFTRNADLSRVNMAGLARDGDQIHVPALTSDADEIALPTPSGGQLVYINSATQEELKTLPGIGTATAQDIISYRDEFGPFNSLEELDAVPGIGPATLDNLSDLISFD